MSQKSNVTTSKGSSTPASPQVGTPTKGYGASKSRNNMKPTLPKGK